MIASADGRVVRIGRNARLGRYVTIEDSYGDRFTYAQLGRVESVYPVLKPRVQSAVRIGRALDAGLPRNARIPAATKFLASASTSGSTPATHRSAARGAARVTPQAQ